MVSNKYLWKIILIRWQVLTSKRHLKFIYSEKDIKIWGYLPGDFFDSKLQINCIFVVYNIYNKFKIWHVWKCRDASRAWFWIGIHSSQNDEIYPWNNVNTNYLFFTLKQTEFWHPTSHSLDMWESWIKWGSKFLFFCKKKDDLNMTSKQQWNTVLTRMCCKLPLCIKLTFVPWWAKLFFISRAVSFCLFVTEEILYSITAVSDQGS